MKFRLKTLFALTAVAGVWFFLARLNPWLPVLLALVFGPATVAFTCKREWIVQGTTCSLALLFSIWIAVPDIHDGWSARQLNVDGSKAIFWHQPTDTMSQSNDYMKADMEYTQEGFSKLGEYHRRMLIINWRLILVTPFLYGITLHLLARWLERRKAAA